MKKIRNIRLISDRDPEFLNYQRSFKRDKPLLTNKEKSKTEIAAFVLELATRAWIYESGFEMIDRIIAYDVYDKRRRKLHTCFSEADYLFIKDDMLILGEVKTSYDSSNILSKAISQLIRKKDLLGALGYKVKLQIIFFNLACNQSINRINNFNESFSQMEFSIMSRNNLDFEFLHLNPKDLYDWGFPKGVIKTPEIVDMAIKEGESRAESRKNKRKAKDDAANENLRSSTVNIPEQVSRSTQGLCERSHFLPSKTEIARVIKIMKEDVNKTNTIIIARYKWLKENLFLVPESKRILNMCIEIKNGKVVRAFFSETLTRIMNKLNYRIIVLN